MPTPAQSAPEVVVRHLDKLTEFDRCCELEKLVWAGADADLVPETIFVVTRETGGQVLGAFAGEQMIGFTLAMPAFHAAPGGGQQLYLHSHMTAVLGEYRDRGVGRQLKLFQREDALARRIPLVEWTFDPLEMRNAHFNLMRLGAIVRTYRPNFYGITTSPLHGGMPTDRLVAEWWLRSRRVERIVSGEGREARRSGGPEVKTIFAPAQMPEWKRSDPRRAIAAQARIREEFQRWLGQDYVVTGIEPSPEGSRYVLEPYEAVKGDLA